MANPLDWMNDELRDRRREGNLRRRRAHSADLVDFSSNDYLDLATDERLARASATAAKRYGTGAGASPLVSGWSRPLRRLEKVLAAWEGTEAALVFSSGYAANLAVLTSVAGRGDAVFSDQLNHASLVDGCRLSRAAVHIYAHADLADLDRQLTQTRARRKIIVSDSVFSMDGDLVLLPALLELAERHDALVVLDEAHATGVLGKNGRGVTDLLPNDFAFTKERLIKVGTLSKALGSQGGFVCGSKLLRRFLVNKARPYIFSTALAPSVAASARMAIRIVQQEPERRRHLWNLSVELRARLRSLGFPVNDEGTPIVPVHVGDSTRAVQWSRHLEQRGLLVPAIRPPSVPPGTARLRISLTAGHQLADIDRLTEALEAMRTCRT